jgi:formate dehydrogenase maturation protein FdhE
MRTLFFQNKNKIMEQLYMLRTGPCIKVSSSSRGESCRKRSTAYKSLVKSHLPSSRVVRFWNTEHVGSSFSSITLHWVSEQIITRTKQKKNACVIIYSNLELYWESMKWSLPHKTSWKCSNKNFCPRSNN